jgi:hypothetical protein
MFWLPCVSDSVSCVALWPGYWASLSARLYESFMGFPSPSRQRNLSQIFSVSPRKRVLHEKLYLPGYNAVYSGESQPTFQRNMLPSSESMTKALKMETICSPETSVDFQRTTRLYVPEDSTLHNHSCENLRSWGILHDFSQPLQTREF